MNARHQRGNSVLVLVIIVLFLGLLLLNSLDRQLDILLLMAGDERRYLRAYNQAISSLNWGINRTWNLPLPFFYHSTRSRTILSWHCEEQPADGLKACIKPAMVPGVFVIKGESPSFTGQSPVMLYQRVAPENQLFYSGENNKLMAIKRGMLDFCPERNDKFCAE